MRHGGRFGPPARSVRAPTMPEDRPPIVAITGGYLTANKGGAAMTLAVHDHVRERGSSTRLLTIYPDADEAQGRSDSRRRRGALVHLLVALVFALLMPVARALHLPTPPARVHPGPACSLGRGPRCGRRRHQLRRRPGHPDRRLQRTDDGIPLLLGRRRSRRPRRWARSSTAPNPGARTVLPHDWTVCARGDRTEAHVRGLGLTNVAPPPTSRSCTRWDRRPASVRRRGATSGRRAAFVTWPPRPSCRATARSGHRLRRCATRCAASCGRWARRRRGSPLDPPWARGDACTTCRSAEP